GLFIAASMMLPLAWLTNALKLCPLIFVLLGIEVVYYSLQRTDAKIKYDFLSMFICFILIVSGLCVAMVPQLFTYYGPTRQMTEQRLQREVENRCYEILSDETIIEDCTVYFSFGCLAFDEHATADTTLPELSRVSVDLWLTGPYTDKNDFAKDCARILGKLNGSDLPITFVSFSYDKNDGSPAMSLSLDGVFNLHQTAQLAQSVNVSDPALYDEGESASSASQPLQAASSAAFEVPPSPPTADGAETIIAPTS
ncbi:MAG: hypothetical protein RR075_05355, partial [Pygmaiobacter sp.]